MKFNDAKSNRDSGARPRNSPRNSHTYDLAGNRTQSIYSPYQQDSETIDSTYNSANQLEEAISDVETSFEYFYDLNGNRTTSAIYDYNAANGVLAHDRESRLVSNSPNDSRFGQSVSYVYDYSGRRIMRNQNGTKTKFYYDGINNLLTSEKPSGGSCWRTKTVYALSEDSIGQVISTRDYTYSGTSCTPSSSNDTWFKYDAIGNVVATVNDVGIVTSNIDMEAFGKIHAGGIAGPRLTTKEYDSASQLYYFAARWYDPKCGLFLEKDPVKTLFDHNRYLFVKQNPKFFQDPSGKTIENDITNYNKCFNDCLDDSGLFPGFGSIPIGVWCLIESKLYGGPILGGSLTVAQILTSLRCNRECLDVWNDGEGVYWWQEPSLYM